MALNSVITVNVADAAFRDHLDKLQKYHEKIAQTPSKWGAAGDDQKKQTNIIDKFSKTVKDSVQPLIRIKDSTDKIVKNIEKATGFLLKWTGIATVFGLATGAGGFFGLDRLALSAAQQGKSSSGMGVSVGQANAFRINQNRYLDNPDSTLAKVEQLNNSFDRWKLETIIGHSTDGLSNVEIAEQATVAARKKFLAGGSNYGTAEAGQLTSLFSRNELKTLAANSPEQLAQSNSDTNRDIARLDLGKGTTDAWQDFLNKLDRAGTTIENSFIKALVKLAGPLGDVTDAFSTFLDKIVNSGLAGDVITNIGKGFKWLGDTMTDPQFEASFLHFLDSIDTLGKQIFAFAEKVWHYVGGDSSSEPDKVNSDGSPHPTSWFERATGLGGGEIPDPRLDPRSRSYDPTLGTKAHPAPGQLQDPSTYRFNSAVNTGPWLPGSIAPTGDMSLPRGLRNNNPGNIDYARQTGAEIENSHALGHTQAVFQNMTDGVNAMAGLFARKYDHRSLSSILEEYSPRTDHNDTDRLIRDAAKNMGVDKDQILDLSQGDTMKKLIRATIINEGFGKYADEISGKYTGGGLQPVSPNIANNAPKVTVTVNALPGASAQTTVNGLVHPG